jgi:uncharacterized protein
MFEDSAEVLAAAACTVRLRELQRKSKAIPAVIAGFLFGYSSRLAFGCNVGAFFSGISTGSLHGWAWFAAAFVGWYYGVTLRPLLQLEERP